MLHRPRRASALSWCRALGNTHAKLRKYRPSATRPVILFGDTVKQSHRDILMAAQRDARAFLASRYNFDFAARVDIAVGATAQELVTAITRLMTSRGEDTSDVESYVQNHCGDFEHWDAAALYNQIFICVPTTASDASTARSHILHTLTLILVHEYVHHYQFEYSLAKSPAQRVRSNASGIGPGWLVEAAAMLVELDYNLGYSGDIAWPRFSYYWINARPTTATLSELYYVTEDDEYEASLFAGHLLARRTGLETLFGFWREMGRGRSEDSAFKATFDMSLEDFEVIFEKARGNYAFALAFANGG